MFDYTVRDSSIYNAPDLQKAKRSRTNSILVGIVRSVQVTTEKTPLYRVECFLDGQIVSMGCVLVTRFGGAHNFEEYGIRPYYPKGIDILPDSGLQYDSFALKNGDSVLVAPLGGDMREGVIIGGMNHGGRTSTLEIGDIAYKSVFNGYDTTIKNDGTMLCTWNGLAINDELLNLPPLGQKPPEPQYDPLVSGSYYGFDTKGSFTVSDGSGQLIKIKKSTGNISIVSGLNRIEIGTTDVVGGSDTIGVQTGQLNISCKGAVDVFSLETVKIQGVQAVSIKGLTVAIGNEVFELIAGMIEIIDAIGESAVTSPAGPCNSLNTTVTWLAKVETLKAKMSTLQGDLTDAENTITNLVLDEDNLTDSLI